MNFRHLVAVDEKGVVDKLLHEGALRLEVEVLDLLDLDAPVVLVLLHVHLLRVEPRRRLQHRHLLRDLEGLGDVGQVRGGQVDLVGDVAGAGELVDLLVLLHLHDDGLDLGEGVVVRPHHAPVVRQVVVDADVAGAV